MSMELYVLSESRLNSIGEWQRSIDGMGLSLRLSTGTPFAQLRGALPVVFERRPSYFECDHWDFEDLQRAYAEIHFDKRLKATLAMRWGSDIDAACSAYTAAAAYAGAVGGVVFDSQEGAFISSGRAIEIANELNQSRSIIEAAARAATQRFKNGR